MHFYLSIKCLILFFATASLPVGNYDHPAIESVENTVTYEIFNENSYPGVQYSSEITYKKAPTTWVKVFNK